MPFHKQRLILLLSAIFGFIGLKVPVLFVQNTTRFKTAKEIILLDETKQPLLLLIPCFVAAIALLPPWKKVLAMKHATAFLVFGLFVNVFGFAVLNMVGRDEVEVSHVQWGTDKVVSTETTTQIIEPRYGIALILAAGIGLMVSYWIGRKESADV